MTRVSEKIFGSPAFWIFVAVCAYFVYALYFAVYGLNFGIGFFFDHYVYDMISPNPLWWAFFYYGSEGLMSSVAGILRLTAGCFGVYSAFLYLRKKDQALPLIRGTVSKALLFEACHYFALSLSMLASFVYCCASDSSLFYFGHTPELIFVYVCGIPLLAIILVVPPVLLKLRARIKDGAETSEILRWSCLAGVAYLFFVFWFNFSMSWAGNMVPYGRSAANYGIDFLVKPANFVSFVATVFGLLALAVMALVTTLPVIRKQTTTLNLRRIGVVIFGLGGYFLFSMFYYYLTGGFAANSSVWYEVIGPLHNPYFWCLSLFFLGIAVMLHRDDGQSPRE